MRQAKKAIAYGSETDLETAMILAIEAYNATVVTEDRLEGVRAFNEKRKPAVQGPLTGARHDDGRRSTLTPAPTSSGR